MVDTCHPPQPAYPHPMVPTQFWSQGYACWQEKSAKTISTLAICPQHFPSASGKERPFSNWWHWLGKLKCERVGFPSRWLPRDSLSVLPSVRRVTNRGRPWHCLLSALCGCCWLGCWETVSVRKRHTHPLPNCSPGMMPSLNCYHN